MNFENCRKLSYGTGAFIGIIVKRKSALWSSQEGMKKN